MESACYHQGCRYSKLPSVKSSFGEAQITLRELIDRLHPLFLRGAVPGHPGALRAEKVIAMRSYRSRSGGGARESRGHSGEFIGSLLYV